MKTNEDNVSADINMLLEAVEQASSLGTNQPDLYSTLEEIMERLQSVVPYESGTVHRWTKGQSFLVPVLATGFGANQLATINLPLEHSLSGQALLSWQPAIYNNIAQVRPANFFSTPGSRDINGLMVAPLLKDERGDSWVLTVRRFDERIFSDHEFKAFKIFANLTSNAIRNANLYQAALQDAETLQKVNRVMRSVGKEIDFNRLNQKLADQVGQELEYERLVVAFIENNELLIRANYCVQNHATMTSGSTLPLAGSAAQRTIESGKLFVRPDLQQIEGEKYHEDELLVKEHVRSYVILPLNSETGIRGIILVSSYWPHNFKEADLHFLETLAMQFTSLLQTVLLFERVSRTRREWQLTLDAIQDAMMLIDATDFSLLQVNKSAARLVNRRPEELIGRGVADTFYQIDPCLATFPVEQLHPENEPLNEELSGTYSGRIYQRTLYPIFSVNGALTELVAHVRDVTETKMLQEQLSNAARMKAVGEMASGIAHDFNNSLAEILGNLELMLLEPLAAPLQSQLLQIRQAALNSADTVKRIQNFGRRDLQKERTRFSLSKIAREVVELTRPRWHNQAQRKGIYIGMVQQYDGELEVLGIPAEIKDVITNFIFNAVDAMPTGGTITVAGYKQSQKRGARLEDVAVLEISDTGTGIPSEVQNHIFEAFYTTKGQQGTGMGLHSAHKIIVDHRGEISFDTDPRRGTSFYVQLPLAENDPFGSPVSQTPLAAAFHSVPQEKRPRHILIVDDDPALSAVLRRILERSGHKVKVANSGSEGLRFFQQAKTPNDGFDMVFTDLSMPEMSGYELARHIKELDSRVVVAFITGWGNELSIESLEQYGIDLLITKPYRIEEVVELVNQAVTLRETYLQTTK